MKNFSFSEIFEILIIVDLLNLEEKESTLQVKKVKCNIL